MSDKHWSESLNDGLEVVSQGLNLINPLDWLGRAVSSNTNYVERALGDDGYNDQGNIKRSFVDYLTNISPSSLKRIQDRQIDKFVEGPSRIAQRARDYNIDLKDNGKFNNLRQLNNKVEQGDTRYKKISDAGISISSLQLPDGQNFATTRLPVFDQHLKKAISVNQKNNSLVNAGIDPGSVKSRAEANEAIRKKQTADEIEKRTAIDEAREKSPQGIREADAHAKGLELTDQQIAASKSTARVNEGTLDLNRVNAENTQTLNLYDRDVDKYRYEDGKYEKGLDRKFEADREDARFAANLETIKLQNAAEMERYEMMLQNDREVRQGDSISDLMSALTMLGGAFML